ncbi:hypothetical protein [Undibacterium luofuense]|uniref:Uncharacterized protein n=1 Tax=Undibacterium luofuense TaxID=2828733 RepID=A0A941DJE0_9BURK|nr:hypothetical protein [Undibacterium luofuense]MBR7781873.1 hypothetical protein [Undibacterium luofuense]
MQKHENKLFEIIFHIMKNLLKFPISNIKLIYDFASSKESLFSSLNDSKKRNGIFSGLGTLCILAIIAGIILNLWLTSFPYTYNYYQISSAFTKNPISTIATPFIIILAYIAFEVFTGLLLTKKIINEFKLNFVETCIITLLLTSMAIIFATMSTAIGAITSNLIIKLPIQSEFPSTLIVAISTLIDLFAISLGALYYLNFSFKKIKIEFGINSEFELKRIKSSLLIYMVSLYSAVYLGNYFSTQALIESSSRVLNENNSSISNAKKYPIPIAVNYCASKESNITCSITLAPNRYQNYTLYSNWEARIEAGKDKDGNIPLIIAINWRPNIDSKNIIPTLHFESGKLTDLELTTTKNNACEFEKMMVSNETAVFFQAYGRSDENNFPKPLIVRMRIEFQGIFKELLKTACNASEH